MFVLITDYTKLANYKFSKVLKPN